MSLSDRIPSNKRAIDSARISSILWISGLGFAASTAILLLLQRLGLPMPFVVGITAVMILVSVVALSWTGRTMTSSVFFFGNRMAASSQVGLAGGSDWIGGAFLVLFFTVPLTGRMVLATALVLGMVLQAGLFSNPFRRSGVLTLPGFVGWRLQSRLAGQTTLLVVTAVLVLLMIAEFKVARELITSLAGLDAAAAGWLIIAVALLPSLTGGWLALLLINSSLIVWILISLLLPAVVTGFFPAILRSGLELDQAAQTLPALLFESFTVDNPLVIVSDTFGASAPVLFATLCILAAGFSVLPHALSRSALSARHTDSLETVAWSSLVVFLVMSALPLSIGLIGATPSSSTLSVLLESQPVLHMLPYLGLLFAATNALAVTLFVGGSSIVRGVRRSRNLDPGEQSIFSTRFLAVMLGLGLVTLSHLVPYSPGQLLIWALILGAGGLFIPLIACAWISNIPSLAISLSISAGGGVTACLLFLKSTQLPVLEPPLCGLTGMVAAALVIILGRLYATWRPNSEVDLPRDLLRNPD